MDELLFSPRPTTAPTASLDSPSLTETSSFLMWLAMRSLSEDSYLPVPSFLQVFATSETRLSPSSKSDDHCFTLTASSSSQGSSCVMIGFVHRAEGKWTHLPRSLRTRSDRLQMLPVSWVRWHCWPWLLELVFRICKRWATPTLGSLQFCAKSKLLGFHMLGTIQCLKTVVLARWIVSGTWTKRVDTFECWPIKTKTATSASKGAQMWQQAQRQLIC